MKRDIERLKERFVNTEDERDEEIIDLEMMALMDKDINAFAEGLLECARDANQR